MNIQRRIPFTTWVLRWISWQRGECYFCLGLHIYPRGPHWNRDKRFDDGGVHWYPIDSATLHVGPLTILLTNDSEECHEFFVERL